MGSPHRRKNRASRGRAFWEREYAGKKHLALSTNPSEDLEKFTRWLEREHGHQFLNPQASVADLGCGNGRNLVYLARTFGMRGVGFDISEEAVAQAKKLGEGLPLTYSVHSLSDPIPLPDASQTIVLDMMASHVLHAPEREALRKEIFRILRPGGWLFFKTFLLDEDRNAAELLREHPADEAHSYIHPEIGAFEHVATKHEIEETLSTAFTIHAMKPSHRHLLHGRAHKRRSISVYAQKPEY